MKASTLSLNIARAGLCLLLAWASGASAAPYKWVDSEGRVTYGDRPPAGSDAQRMDGAGFGAGAGPRQAAATGGPNTLPAGLQRAVERHPVALYTGRNCQPCDEARAHLAARGVPYSEFTITQDADLDVFKQQGFTQMRIPALKVGNEREVGFEAGAWNRLLDSAGYPEKSALPKGYVQTPPAPLASSGAGTTGAGSTGSGSAAGGPQAAGTPGAGQGTAGTSAANARPGEQPSGASVLQALPLIDSRSPIRF